MKHPFAIWLACAGLSACAGPAMQQRAAVLDYLYPEGTEPAPPADVHLALPLRVGVAFAPGTAYGSALDESRKQRLLQRVVEAFQGTEGVQSIQIVPSSYLKDRGGFQNVDQLRSLLGIDLIALLSYEQTQFQDFTKASLTYWTVVGAYYVRGNENETHTFVDTSVFDIPSRALLFNAAGRNELERKATAIEASEKLREDSARGFEAAVEDMIANLRVALDAFREQARSGTVRGAGTPGVQVTGGSGQGAGASGALELALGLVLAGGFLARRRAAAG